MLDGSSNKLPLGASDLVMLLYKRMRDFALGYEEKRCGVFLNYVRGLDCLFHEKQRGEPHHIFGSVGGMKSADIFVVPLCRECHEYHESNPAANYNLMEHWMIMVAKLLMEKLCMEKIIEDSQVDRSTF